MFTLKERAPKTQTPLAIQPFHFWENPQGEQKAEFYRISSGYLLRFGDLADFEVNPSEHSIYCTPNPEVSTFLISSLYFNQVLPLLGSTGEGIILHASAINLGGNAIAFLGRSGDGKSTLATAFAKSGHPFITDDGLWLRKRHDRFIAYPNRPSLRLKDDSVNALFVSDNGVPWLGHDGVKTLVAANESVPYDAGEIPLKALFVLNKNPVARITVKELKPNTAHMAILRQSFLLEVDNKIALKRNFEAISDLVERVSCFELSCPHDYKMLDHVIDEVVGRRKLWEDVV